MSESNSLDEMLEGVESSVQDKVGDRTEAQEGFQEAIGGQIDQTFRMVVENGQGQTKSASRTTWGVTIDGNFEILSPKEGAWHLVAKDIAQGKVIANKENVVAGEKIPFKYKTGLKCQLDFGATWTESENTTLSIHVVAGY